MIKEARFGIEVKKGGWKLAQPYREALLKVIIAIIRQDKLLSKNPAIDKEFVELDIVDDLLDSFGIPDDEHDYFRDYFYEKYLNLRPDLIDVNTFIGLIENEANALIRDNREKEGT